MRPCVVLALFVCCCMYIITVNSTQHSYSRDLAASCLRRRIVNAPPHQRGLLAGALLQDWTEDAVNVVPNFDGTTQEPVVLPARIPFSLLLNGAAGIAVGMATNVPPHNLRELMTACTRLTQSRRAEGVPVSADELLRIVPGPDFPTGGTIVGVEGARQLYSLKYVCTTSTSRIFRILDVRTYCRHVQYILAVRAKDTKD